MADNLSYTPGTGATVATDDVGGIHYQRVKQSLGADGSATDAASGAGPVTDGVQRMTMASDDPLVTATGAIADAAVTNPALSASIIALLKGLLTKTLNAAGFGAVDASTPRVVLANDDLAVAGIGAKADAAVTNPATAASIIAILKGLLTKTLAPSVNAGAADATTARVISASDDPVAAAAGAKTDAAVTDPTAAASIVAALKGLMSLVTGQSTSAVYSGTTALTPKFAAISTSASGATAIVAAVAGKKIRVLSCQAIAAGNTNVKWQSAATDKTGLAYLSASGGYVLPHNPLGWFETAVNEALNINLSAAVGVGGSITYVEV